jgi:hypothetical protein
LPDPALRFLGPALLILGPAACLRLPHPRQPVVDRYHPLSGLACVMHPADPSLGTLGPPQGVAALDRVEGLALCPLGDRATGWFQRQRMAGDITDLPVFDAFDAIAVISHDSCTHQVRPAQLRRCWCPWPGLPTTGIGPHRHRDDPGAVRRAAGACYHRDLAVFKPWGQTRFQRR